MDLFVIRAEQGVLSKQFLPMKSVFFSEFLKWLSNIVAGNLVSFSS